MQARMRRMLQTIEEEYGYTARLTGRGRLDPRVFDAMAAVPREAFVPEELRDAAYDDRPLPIGHGQTISQPYIVALMSDLLELKPEARVLEVGTGSGYQTAVLARLAAQVFTIETVAALGASTAERLRSLGCRNVTTRVGDGYYGWPEAAPFDGIIVTAAAAHVPPPLIAQLRPGGRLVIPVGVWQQALLLITREPDQRVTTREILPVVFVPLTGDHPPPEGTP